MNTQKVLLTGDRPTGPLHIGHYFGSLVSRKALETEYETYIMQADIQALTDNWDDTTKVRNAVYEVALDNLAMGIDPERTTLFIQSQIPQIAELTVLFSNLVTVNRLQRNPTIKTELAQKKDKFGTEGESITFGFLGYPVSQAADILFIRGDIVPVGEDQLPVIEICQDIATKFNKLYQSDIFPYPKAKLSETPRILGLDGNAKMSKSLGNCIYLKDTPEATLKKIKSAKTDSLGYISYEPDTRPEVSNLVLLYSLVSGYSIDTICTDMRDIGYGAFKQNLGDKMNEYFAEFRARRMELEQRPEYVREMLEKGRLKVLAKAEETMKLVRESMGIDY